MTIPIGGASGRWSGVQIRNHHRFQSCDRILELQLAFLEAAQFELVAVELHFHLGDGEVELAVFGPQVADLGANLGVGVLDHAGVGSRLGSGATPSLSGLMLGVSRKRHSKTVFLHSLVRSYREGG